MTPNAGVTGIAPVNDEEERKMKTKCTEGSLHGDKVKVSFYIPEQERIDAGELPVFSIDVLDLLVEEESNGVEGTAGLFVVDALAVFMDEAHDADSEESVAQWLETMAAKVRGSERPRVGKNVPACFRCNWWSFMNSATGKCKRMPPAAHFEDGHYWPITGRGDWCGEFTSTFADACHRDEAHPVGMGSAAADQNNGA